MTDTIPAAAIGLPSFERRNFLGVLIAAGVMTGAAELPALASADHPDAELLEMEAQMIASRARMNEFYRVLDKAYERYVEPEIPPALIWQEGDRYHVSSSVDLCDERRIDGVWRSVYESEENLTQWAQRYCREGDAYANPHFTETSRARTREIKGALDAYREAERKAEDAVGITGPREAGDREFQLIGTLSRKIAATPALSLEGMAAKARAAIAARYSSASVLRKERIPDLLSCDAVDWDKVYAFSLIVDAVRLGELAGAPSTARAA